MNVEQFIERITKLQQKLYQKYGKLEFNYLPAAKIDTTVDFMLNQCANLVSSIQESETNLGSKNDQKTERLKLWL